MRQMSVTLGAILALTSPMSILTLLPRRLSSQYEGAGGAARRSSGDRRGGDRARARHHFDCPDSLSPDLELFPLNRHELRTVKTASNISMPQSWADGAKAAGEAAAEFFAGLRPDGESEPTQSCKILGFSTPNFDGMPIDALAIKADIEARAKEEKLAKWEARHGRPGKPSPPPPSPVRASARRSGCLSRPRRRRYATTR